MTAEIGILMAIIGCFVGLAGWLSGRDKKISADAEWKGSVNESLKDIKDGVFGIDQRIAKIEGMAARITVLETKISERKTS